MWPGGQGRFLPSCSSEATSGVMTPEWVSLTFKRDRERDQQRLYKDAEGTGTSLQGGKAERLGALYPGEDRGDVLNAHQ